ncbi:MAG: hypothetical protein D4S01_03280 [Dehalococcoidia bacterium]|nr:MAG: hypothetical protein D4S01_03280 [Dehalococcoidia bacterium]
MSWIKLTSLGFEVPPSFPTEDYDKVRSFLEKYKDTHPAQCKSFGLGWHGLAYRYRTLVEYDKQFTNSVKVSNSPPPEERYNQGKALFGFFVNALSVIECFFYSTYCIASILKPDVFPISKSKDLKFYPKDVASKYGTCFSGDCLSIKMNQCLHESKYKEMKDMRDVLTHRGMPPRAFYVGGDRDGMATMPVNIKDPSDQWHFDLPVDAQTTAVHRQWLCGKLNSLMAAAVDFCNQRLNCVL